VKICFDLQNTLATVLLLVRDTNTIVSKQPIDITKECFELVNTLAKLPLVRVHFMVFKT